MEPVPPPEASENTTPPRQASSHEESYIQASSSSEALEKTPLIDVAVLGAGPTGLALAIDLARKGINFEIFDMLPYPSDTNKVASLFSHSIEILDDLGVLEQAMRCASHIKGLRLLIDGTVACDFSFKSKLLDSPFPFILVIEQSKIEEILTEKLISLGKQVNRPCTIWKIEGASENIQQAPHSSKPSIGDAPRNASSGKKAVKRENQREGNEPNLFQLLSDSFGGSIARVSLDSGVVIEESDRASSIDDPSEIPIRKEKVWSETSSSSAEVASSAVFLHCKKASQRTSSAGSSGGSIEKSSKVKASGTADFDVIGAKLVVGCDGHNSIVRKSADIPLLITDGAIEFLIVDSEIVWPSYFNEEKLHIFVSEIGSMICYKLRNFDCWRLQILYSSQSQHSSAFSPDYIEIQAVLEKMVPGSQILKLYSIEPYTMESRIAQTFWKGPLLLAGDAAHTHPYVLGHGMDLALQDAYNLGWKLAEVLTGKAHTDLLHSYSEERQLIADDLASLALSNGVCRTILSQILQSKLFRSCISMAAPYIHSQIEAVVVEAAQMLSLRVECYTQGSDFITKDKISSGSLAPGHRVPDCLIKQLKLHKMDFSRASKCSREKSKYLYQFLQGGHYTLILCLNLLPPGTKAKNVFGCEVNDLAGRWSKECYEKLSNFERVAMHALNQRSPEGENNGNSQSSTCCSSTATSACVVWVLCGLASAAHQSSGTHTKLLDSLVDLIPRRLLKSLTERSFLKQHITVDDGSEVCLKFALSLASPSSRDGKEKSGCFYLVRPDGFISHNGYAGDGFAIGCCMNYILNYASYREK